MVRKLVMLHILMPPLKNGPTFWKCWRSKFESVNKCNEVNGCVDGDTFREHFSMSYTSNDASHAVSLKSAYTRRRFSYKGFQGVRQGSVLSPFMFAVYTDDIANVSNLRSNLFIVLYTDDIILVAPTVGQLKSLFNSCQEVLDSLDMKIQCVPKK